MYSVNRCSITIWNLGRLNSEFIINTIQHNFLYNTIINKLDVFLQTKNINYDINSIYIFHNYKSAQCLEY